MSQNLAKCFLNKNCKVFFVRRHTSSSEFDWVMRKRNKPMATHAIFDHNIFVRRNFMNSKIRIVGLIFETTKYI